MTYTQILDEIFGLFNQGVINNSVTAIGYVPNIYWDGVQSLDAIDQTKITLDIVNNVISDNIETIGHVNERLFKLVGYIRIDINCPITLNQSLYTGRKLIDVIINIYKGVTTNSGIWFRGIKINENIDYDVVKKISILIDYECSQTA